MSPKVDHRRLAKEQRRHLKKDGRFTEHDIQAFAQLFKPPTDPDPRIVCAADKEADR